MAPNWKQISMFTIMTSMISSYTTISEHNIPENVNLQQTYKPEQIHLSIGSSGTNFSVMWATKVDEGGFVEYGNDFKSSRADSKKIELTNDSSKAARFLHRAELKDLLPGLSYWYYIVSGTSGTRSDKLLFEVPHNDLKLPHKFVVLADMGLFTKSLPFMVHEILNRNYQIVFHIGDIAYNLDTDEGSIGDRFMNKIENFTSRVPYMTTPGDHEKAKMYYHYRHRFSMPNAPWPMTVENLWYSIDIGHTHFISINTQLVLHSDLSKAQLQWLRKDLIDTNKNRKANPWIIVMGHKPMYCTKSVMAQDCDDGKSPLREQFEDLFFEQGVDLYISGHKHCYERSWPMYQSQVFQTDTFNPMAPIYIISGTLGYEYLVDAQYSHPYWLAFAVTDGNKELYARLTIVNESNLIWSLHAVMSNEVIENVHIIQSRHGSFGTPGVAAFSKIKLQSSNQKIGLPLEPFFIINAPTNNNFRRVVLYALVITLSLILAALLRSIHFRKLCCFRR